MRIRASLIVLISGAIVFLLSRLMAPSDSVVAEAINPVWQAVVPPVVNTATALPPPTFTPTLVTSPTSTPTIVPSATPAPTVTPSPSPAPTKLPSPTTSATQTPIPPTAIPALKPTATPDTTLSATAAAVGQPTATLRARSLRLNALAAAYDALGRPYAPTTEFAAGTKVLFLFFDYTDLPADIQIQHIWTRNGQPPNVQRTVWSKPGDGLGYLMLQLPNGFDAGLWEVRVFLEDKQQFVANFVVK